MREFTFPVDAGQVLQFARAIGDPNPVYRDRRAATALGFAGIIAPPTFVMAGDHFDPEYPRRPDLATVGGSAADGTHEALLHVSQHFSYTRAIRAGETLTARRHPPRMWTKQGRRGGALEFIELVTEYVDEVGEVAVMASWTDVRTEKTHQSLTVAGPIEGDDAAPEPSGVEVVRSLTRTQIVMYVGAAGDFHPLHHDDVYARAQGYPGVFAPGMLTMALTGRAVTDALGAGSLREFGGRLTGQVWPGDTLYTEVAPAEPSGATSARPADEMDEVTVKTTNQRGAVVFDGRAAAAAGAR